MKKILAFVSISLLLFSCQNNQESSEEQTDYSAVFLTEEIPGKTPVSFLKELVPDSTLIHRGIFSPDLSEYYYSLSDWQYEVFTTKVIKKVDSTWSEPQDAFFNTSYSEHGTTFSPDGNTLYFSSTRPVAPIEGKSIAATWHIWRSEKIDGAWQEPEYVDIPNMRNQLVSHPSFTNSGTMYFHSSNVNFSDMTLYRSKFEDGKFQAAEELTFAWFMTTPKTTPYIAPDESYLLFASVESQLFLTIAYPDGNGNWIGAKKLHRSINANGQGNPYVTPDGKFLFYVGNENNTNEAPNWHVKWVSMDAVPTTPLND